MWHRNLKGTALLAAGNRHDSCTAGGSRGNSEIPLQLMQTYAVNVAAGVKLLHRDRMI
jgi:hypothetical protein